MHGAATPKRIPGIRDALDRDVVPLGTLMQICRQRLLLRLPKHPTIAGWFWFAYFLALGWMFFG